jgi:hypothetical protein
MWVLTNDEKHPMPTRELAAAEADNKLKERQRAGWTLHW